MTQSELITKDSVHQLNANRTVEYLRSEHRRFSFLIVLTVPFAFSFLTRISSFIGFSLSEEILNLLHLLFLLHYLET
jgi:hypothetical protein